MVFVVFALSLQFEGQFSSDYLELQKLYTFSSRSEEAAQKDRELRVDQSLNAAAWAAAGFGLAIALRDRVVIEWGAARPYSLLHASKHDNPSARLTLDRQRIQQRKIQRRFASLPGMNADLYGGLMRAQSEKMRWGAERLRFYQKLSAAVLAQGVERGERARVTQAKVFEQLRLLSPEVKAFEEKHQKRLEFVTKKSDLLLRKAYANALLQNQSEQGGIRGRLAIEWAYRRHRVFQPRQSLASMGLTPFQIRSTFNLLNLRSLGTKFFQTSRVTEQGLVGAMPDESMKAPINCRRLLAKVGRATVIGSLGVGAVAWFRPSQANSLIADAPTSSLVQALQSEIQSEIRPDLDRSDLIHFDSMDLQNQFQTFESVYSTIILKWTPPVNWTLESVVEALRGAELIELQFTETGFKETKRIKIDPDVRPDLVSNIFRSIDLSQKKIELNSDIARMLFLRTP